MMMAYSYIDLLRRWFHKQFVEASASYVEACGATAYFCKTPQTPVPTEFGTHPPLEG